MLCRSRFNPSMVDDFAGGCPDGWEPVVASFGVNVTGDRLPGCLLCWVFFGVLVLRTVGKYGQS